MLLDARSIGDGAVLETDVCVIGAGPAGLTVATEFAGTAADVVLLESGSRDADDARQALNAGEAHGDPYAGLRATRHRGLGGTTRLWNTPVAGATGGRYTPLAAIDFEVRPWVAHSGWPFTREHLLPWYERAQQACGLGPPSYEWTVWCSAMPVAPPDVGPDLGGALYHLGTRRQLVTPKIRLATDAGNIRLCGGATVRALEWDVARGRATAARVARQDGGAFQVRARHFVLAGGAVENARLLLLSARQAGTPDDASGWVGRGFMEHPRDAAMVLRPSRSAWRALASLDLMRQGRHLALGHLAISPAAQADARITGAGVSLLPRIGGAMLRAHRALGRAGRTGVMRRLVPGPGHGWSRHLVPAAVIDGFTVLINLEQAPHPDNRIALGGGRDPLGDPVAALHWRWRADDHARLRRTRELVRQALERAGLGAVTCRNDAAPDPNAHHHAGTTRMHRDPALGVVDADCRVHGMENLWITGASVFPTAGYANPTLTIVALALRLADAIRKELG